ncbi:MAG: hypothetical protein GXO31_05735 [Epsilonproteobacteria bacterium]|nr:hypothetical protein [Campylobacterota bacterium]
MIGQFIKEEKGLFILMLLVLIYICLAILISAYVEYYFFSNVNFSDYGILVDKIIKFFTK